MRVCFHGIPDSGSFAIRGEQLAAARPGWWAARRLGPDDYLQPDLLCLIKRAPRDKMRLLRALGKVVVYDALDCWKQPEDDLGCRSIADARRLFATTLRELPVDGVIFANETMLEDLGDLVPNPTFIYHHFRPSLRPITVRERALRVGYEGRRRYLGEWEGAMERACGRLGLEFVRGSRVRLEDVDIGFAARGRPYASPLSSRYKSNVKLANFYGAALPCIVHAGDAAYSERLDPHVRVVERPEDLEAALRGLLPFEARLEVHRAFLLTRERYRLEAIVGEYERYFAKVLAGALSPT